MKTLQTASLTSRVQSWTHRGSSQSLQITAQVDLLRKKSIRLKQIFVASLPGWSSGTHQWHSRWRLTASLSLEPTWSVPHCHSGHREAEFISRIRLVSLTLNISDRLSCPKTSALQPKRLAAEIRILTRELSPSQTINKPVVWQMKDLQLRQLCVNALCYPDRSAE